MPVKKKRSNKRTVNRLASVYQSKASQIHTLDMSFNVDATNENMAAWHDANNSTNEMIVPEKVVYDSYKGDLAICLRNLLIPDEQIWHISAVTYFYNEDSGDIKEVLYERNTPKMGYEEFRFGGKTIVDHGHGLKKRWQGITKEINDAIEAKQPEGYIYAHTQGYMRVDTAFKNVESFLYFRGQKNAIALGNI